MAKTHEINLDTAIFNQFTNNNYIILEVNDISVNDYVLFKEVKTVEAVTIDTGLFRMTQIKEIIQNEGLKDGYALFIVNKL